MFEDQTITLAKDGMNLDKIAKSAPQYETKKWTNYPKIPKELHELRDGTFKPCPKLFSHIYILLAWYKA